MFQVHYVKLVLSCSEKYPLQPVLTYLIFVPLVLYCMFLVIYMKHCYCCYQTNFRPTKILYIVDEDVGWSFNITQQLLYMNILNLLQSLQEPVWAILSITQDSSWATCNSRYTYKEFWKAQLFYKDNHTCHSQRSILPDYLNQY